MYNSNLGEGAIQCKSHHLTSARLIIYYTHQQSNLLLNIEMKNERKAETESERDELAKSSSMVPILYCRIASIPIPRDHSHQLQLLLFCYLRYYEYLILCR